MSSQNHVLETDRLVLKPFELDDAAFLHALWTDTQVRRYLWDDRVISHEETLEVISASIAGFDQSGFGFWTIDDKTSGLPVGFVGLRLFGTDGETELLYGLLPDHHGQGLATEASIAVLDYGFTTCHLTCIHAGTDPPNADSIRVIERLGMTFEGRREIDGQPALYYYLTTADWRRQMNPGA